MTEKAEVVLDVRPGMLVGTFTKFHDAGTDEIHKVNIPVEQSTSLIQEEILAELKNNPHDVYLLLKGETPLWLQDLLPSVTDIMSKLEACQCGDPNCQEVLTICEEIKQKLSVDPLMILTLIGIPRKDLLSDVLGAWSASTMPQAKEFASIESSLMEEKGKTGPSPGEWLSEAAEQGRLHEPGPLFRDVTLNLTAPDDAELHPDDWTPVLQGTQGVQKALRMILKKTSDIAEKRRRQFIER